MTDNLPLLYSFRRCPYAMRARLALKISGLRVLLREIKLSQKPSVFLEASSKGEVPVLVLPGGKVIEESLDIMLWALNQHDPEAWLDSTLKEQTSRLISENDSTFKQHLDHYKYFERFPEAPQSEYRKQGETFLNTLEDLLQQKKYLLAERCTLADMAIMPFIRQFAGVDRDWFNQSPYQALRQWLDSLIESDLFISIMPKYVFWQQNQQEVFFPAE